MYQHLTGTLHSGLRPWRQGAALPPLPVMPVCHGRLHSPILLTYPGAEIVSFDSAALPTVRLEDTSHYRITKGILEHPESYWRHLVDGKGSDGATSL